MKTRLEGRSRPLGALLLIVPINCPPVICAVPLVPVMSDLRSVDAARGTEGS